MSIINDVFQPVFGKPCWQVKQGYGSFLTFEFGEPHLHIQELRKAPKQSTKTVKNNVTRRYVFVHGDWHLWAYLCDWLVFLQGEKIASDSSPRNVITKALRKLNGQALTKVTVKKSYVSIFEFDLGGKLELSPNRKEYEKTDALWHLYEPSGNVFTLRADGKFCRAPGDRVVKDKWSTLVIPKAQVVVKQKTA